jgi:hypothetical protein
MFHPAQDTCKTSGTTDDASDTVALSGYLVEGDTNGSRRLYSDPGVEQFVEIGADDIVRPSSAAGDGDPPAGQGVVLVRRDANVVRHESMRASSFAMLQATRGQWPRP